jgi:hypothetical protein
VRAGKGNEGTLHVTWVLLPLCGEQVKMERDQFIRTHQQWDDIKEAWVEVTPRKAKK